MGVRAAGLVVVLALLAGCAQPSAPAASSPVVASAPAEGPHALDFSQLDCESMTWSVPVTAASLQPYLPAGFEPSPPEGQAGLQGAATLGFRAIECGHGLGQGTALRSLQTGQLYTTVLPPQELREERFATHYLYVWDGLVATDPWRIDAAPWELPLHDGGSTVGPGSQGWSGALAMDQVGTFTMTGRTTDIGSTTQDLDERAITVGSQGFALWDAEVAGLRASTGIGVWSVNPESWVANLLGSTQGVATFQYATFDLPNALVHWPGQVFSPVEASQGGGIGPTPPLAPDQPPVTVK